MPLYSRRFHVFSFLPSTCNIFTSKNSKYWAPFLLRQFYDTYATNAPGFHLYFWLTETSTALPHSPSARELWLSGKCTKGKCRKIFLALTHSAMPAGGGSRLSDVPVLFWWMCPHLPYMLCFRHSIPLQITGSVPPMWAEGTGFCVSKKQNEEGPINTLCLGICYRGLLTFWEKKMPAEYTWK